MQEQGQSRLDDVSWMDGIAGGEFFLSEETMVPSMLMPDAPVTGLGIEPAVQAFETDTNNITLHSIESRELMQAVTERGSCSKMPTELVEEPRAPVVLMPDEPETRQRTEQAHQSFEMNLNNISSSSMRDFVLRIGRLTTIRGDEISSLYHLETLECNFSDPDDFRFFQSGRRFSQIACKVTVGRPCFSSLEDLNYSRSKSGLIREAWFYDLKLDNANRLIPPFITKAVFVSCQNMRILCPSYEIEGLEILHLDGLIILETPFEVPSKLGTVGVFFNLREMVIHKCHRIKVLLPRFLSTLSRLEVIVVEDCYNLREIMGGCEVCGIENMTWELMQSVAERGSSSNRPVDKSVPSSSNNEAINAASTPVRRLEMEQEEPPLFDESLGWMDIWIMGVTGIVEEPRAHAVLMPDEPKTRQRTEKTCQAFEMILNNISSSSTRDVLLRVCIENMT
uniref:Disease resistance protein n=1 Tax=Populus alba TaxID=43335 RepID=A0A4U5QV60_POPAL|nr:hypothetical protein D5086_0000038390 [Populus alba]